MTLCIKTHAVDNPNSMKILMQQIYSKENLLEIIL